MTLLAIIILSTRERLQLPHAMILSFREVISLSKLAFARSWKPT
jgi:hypothetical protein